MSNALRTSVVIGRFQTPFLTEGHRHLLDTAISKGDILFVVIGCKQYFGQDERNPYSFNDRKEMILRSYPNALIALINDEPDDNYKWSNKLDSMLIQLENPTMYGSRDCFHKHYKGTIPFEEITEIPGVSATFVREIAQENLVEMVFSQCQAAPPRNIFRVLAKLVEEVGELAQEVNIADGFLNKPVGKDGIKGEAIDVMQCVLDVLYLSDPHITPAEINYIMYKKLQKWKQLTE